MHNGINVSDEGATRWITLARPPLNVLDLATIDALHAALADAAGRRPLKCVVIRSGLPDVFSAGVDVAAHAPDRAPAMLEAFHRVCRLIHALPQASVAAVDGSCLGGGCELAACCDAVLATECSRFGQPEIDVGCFPPVASVLLPRLAGRLAYEMILTGEPIPAAEAARIGLVNRVVPDVDAAAEEWARKIGEKSGVVLALARRALRDAQAGTFAEALAERERLYREELLRTDDAAEGVRAFLEKRKPAWK
jgi:cyclohexa-1,5-dienecarbonyl-CoA hydratase